jgi:hypothetical protein
MYDPTVGRFLTEDPIGFNGDPSNVYRYVQNNPLSFTDPSGLTPVGTAENDYFGTGDWTFTSEEEAFAWFEKTFSWNPAGRPPDGWKDNVRNGCIGLNRVRLGLPDNPFQVFQRMSATYASEDSARSDLAGRMRDDPNGVYQLIAIQVPVPSNRVKTDFINRIGGRAIDIRNDIRGVIDFNKAGEFNFATWFPTPDKGGFWEWMTHHFKDGIPAGCQDPPKVRHSETLLQNLPGVNATLTLFGVFKVR